MKKRNVIAALALTMSIGLGATVYAASTDTAVTPSQRLGLGKITSMRGYDYISSVLKNKLGVMDADITNARESGKTLYDLAAEKGMTEDELKNLLLEEKTKSIDSAVEKGTITKEEGETLKQNLNTNIQNCSGNFGEKQGLGQGQGRGQGHRMMGNGQGRGCITVPSNEVAN